MNKVTVWMEPTTSRPIEFTGEHVMETEDGLVVFSGGDDETDYAFSIDKFIRYTVEPL